MAFDREDDGMNSSIPFIKIADHVEVDIALEAKQISGPRLVYNNSEPCKALQKLRAASIGRQP
jgi:hypothetical protein